MLKHVAATLWLFSPLAAAAATTPPPALSAYVSDPAIREPSLAPDGSAVAFLTADGTHSAIRILPKGDAAPHDISAGGANVTDVEWIDPDHIAIIARKLLDQSDLAPQQFVSQIISWRLSTHSSNVALGGMTGVAPFAAGGMVDYGVYKGHSSIFLRGLARGPIFSLFAADADTGVGVLIDKGSFDLEDWVVTPQGQVLASKVLDASHKLSHLIVRSTTRSTIVALPGGPRPFQLRGMGRRIDTIAVTQDGQLYEIGLDGSISAPLQPQGALVTGSLHSHLTGLLSAARLAGSKDRLVFFDDKLRAAFDISARALPGEAKSLIDADDSRNEVLVRTEAPTDPGSYYWVHLAAHKAELIARARPDLPQRAISPVRPFTFQAQDGLQVSGYVVGPSGGDATAPPAVVLVQDPGAQLAGESFDPMAQALASRGYAVVRIAYRGSIGQGDALREAGRGELGRRMQTDLSDAVRHLADIGAVDAKRVCIAGSDYGGYAALSGVILQHGVYRCAIAVNPVSNLAAVIHYPSLYLRGGAWAVTPVWREAVGEARLDGGSLRALSPVDHADAASAPILLVYDDVGGASGGSDAARMHAALARSGKPSELVRLDPKTQGRSAAQDAIATLTAMLDFLAKANPAS